MLLRKITKHVTDQNWFAVFIDFLIVVVGILIAFQITEWSAKRAEYNRVNEILYELRTDLNADIKIYTEAIDSTLNRIAVAEYIAQQAPTAGISNWEDTEELYVSVSLNAYSKLIETSPELQKKSFSERMINRKDQLWSTILDVFNPPSYTASFDSLLNSGELGLFENQDLVSAIQDYRFWTNGLEGMQNNTIRPSRNSSTAVGHIYGLSAFGSVKEDQFIELVQNNSQLAATIQTEYGRAKRHFRVKANVKSNAQKLLKMIESELEIENQSD